MRQRTKMTTERMQEIHTRMDAIEGVCNSCCIDDPLWGAIQDAFDFVYELLEACHHYEKTLQ